jgi:hypothetical protein
MIPNTLQIEEQEIAIENEYRELMAFGESEIWERYNSLKKEIESSEFQNKVKAIGQQKFSSTPEYQQWQKWHDLSKNSHLVSYFKIKKSKDLQRFNELEKAEKTQHWVELEKTVHSAEFKKAEQNKKEFKESNYYTVFEEFNKLKADADIRFWKKFKQSAAYSNYVETEQSTLLKEYNSLLEVINSEDFIQTKKYYEQPAQKKIEASEEYKLIEEFEQLKKSEKIIWYIKNQNSEKFNWIKHWELKFCEEFAGSKLDTDNWLTRYCQADKFLNANYSLEGDYHCYTEGKNTNLKDSVCSIVTRKEKITGEAWSTAFGFFEREFDYTSGLINTAKSFRSKYGIIKAKVKFEAAGSVTHNFWLGADQMLPHIDICKFDMNKIYFTRFSGDGNGLDKKVCSYNASKLSQGWWIIELEWQPGKLIWRVNGLKLYELSSNIPDIDMYLAFSSGLYRAATEQSSSVSFDIDWVRWFQPSK